MPKTKIVRKHTYMRLSKAKGFCTEPQKWVFQLYFDSFSPPNAERSKIRTFLKVSLVSLTYRLGTMFYFFEKMTVISLCWFTMKKWDLCKCFCSFTQKLQQLVLWNKQPPLKQQGYNGFLQINILFNFFSNQRQNIYYNGSLQKVLRNKDSFLDMCIASSAAVK